ncbi:DgyrCDS898 [Dimorphilus gyrociliatus]|uniref:DgyrCDS898 n=1 Tax=Dimorphilus gyrociliatus TaxID=2664684 RepID=A0A7I8V5V7_9ANNE|nr:DgyrCDS898 [Dimorphilus gyrociliatus]
MSGGDSCGHSHAHHDISDSDKGAQFSLYLKIDKERVTCLNESVAGSGKNVFKPWEERLNTDLLVESDLDEELLFNIPFAGIVKLKGIIVVGGEDDYHPNKMRLFKNRPQMTFDDVRGQADEEFDMQPDHSGILEYSTKVARFGSIESLSIHFPSNFGADTTKIYYIGLRGDFTEMKRHGVTITTYEARANPADHKTDSFDSVNHQIF